MLPHYGSETSFYVTYLSFEPVIQRQCFSDSQPLHGKKVAPCNYILLPYFNTAWNFCINLTVYVEYVITPNYSLSFPFFIFTTSDFIDVAKVQDLLSGSNV